ncbi:hypothetical protein F8388_018227 [Cannabis sativa]|uniref:Ubiquitin-like protease family profile domain-containing protein n=1 Tax=Cannabis sativa TaxID=3483 RepID=A0A7J6GAX1_CANSA|nr:hypothetical protein F8388_018227 [Cannabis sativa]
MLQYIYSNSNDTQQVIVRNSHIHLLRSDFRYLGPGKDVEITFLTMVATLLTNDERTKTCGKARRWYLPANITNETLPYNNLPLYQRWKKMHYYDLYMGSLDKCNEIFIPLLFSKHYILARLLVSLKKVEVWDSLADKDSPIVYSSKIKEILRNLDLGLESQIKNKPANFSFASFIIVRADYVPKQPNLFDCGLMCDPFRVGNSTHFSCLEKVLSNLSPWQLTVAQLQIHNFRYSVMVVFLAKIRKKYLQLSNILLQLALSNFRITCFLSPNTNE